MKLAMLFTGQGSQFAGMGKGLAERFEVARQTFAEADAVLGEPLSKLCFEGPEDELALTENTQPATLAVSLAAFRALGRKPDLAAGHSLGEYSALTAAGTFAFGDAVKLVRERARRMQQAVPAGTGGMVVLRKMNLAEVEELLTKITKGPLDLANLNSPGQYVLSGAMAAVDEAVELAGPRRSLKLSVSVPFHSRLLSDAAAGFADVLDATPMRDPAFPIWCNVDATPVTTAAAARDALKRQFAGSVRWQTSVEGMLRDGVRHFVECGPKPVLVKMVVQIANEIGVTGVETKGATTADEIVALASH
jgi:[acyl-carrier-protein] S-malonyltransferase